MEGNGRDNYIIIVTYVSRGWPMMTSITRPQADALAALVHSLRPEWDTVGIIAALHNARERGDGFELAIAALHAASNLTNRTPAVITLAGEHWTKGKALGATNPIRFERCPKSGHTSYPAHNCGACRVDDLEPSVQQTERVPSVSAERVRQILDAVFDEPRRPVDHKTLAGGDSQ